MPDVMMPRLSDSMEAGTIIRWLVEDGSHVTPGTELVEIESDKAVVVYMAEDDGVLTINAAGGETFPVGAVIARVASPGEQVPAPDSKPGGAVLSILDNGGGKPGVIDPGVSSLETQPSVSSTPVTRPKASPIARRIAAERGIDLTVLTGTGPSGRIVRDDVETYGHRLADSHAAAQASARPEGESTRSLTRVQQTIARRMTEAKATVPEFSLSMEISMDAAVELRVQIKEAGDRLIPSFNDLVVKAAALALRRHPLANSSYRDGHIEHHEHVNIGIAVSAPGSILVPTVFDADVKSLTAIAAETRELSDRARAGTATAAALAGGTFTVSNLGMYGVADFVAVISPPQAAILAVGAVEEKPVVVNHALAVGHRMTLTLTCDHRMIYGADAALVLVEIRNNLEQPFRLLLDLPG